LKDGRHCYSTASAVEPFQHTGGTRANTKWQKYNTIILREMMPIAGGSGKQRSTDLTAQRPSLLGNIRATLSIWTCVTLHNVIEVSIST